MDDYAQIQNLKARYCAAVDAAPEDSARAREELLAILVPDIVADYGLGNPLIGAEAMADFMVETVAGGSTWMVHSIHSPHIESEGEEAVGRWTVSARMKRVGTGAIDGVLGRYRDRFVRHNDGWRIAEIRFNRFED